MIKEIKIFVLVVAMLLVYPDECVYAKKYESRYKADRPQGYYNIDENEELVVSDETLYVTRKKFGLLAMGVKDFKVAQDTLLFVGKDKKNTVYQIDLLKKTKNKKICYNLDSRKHVTRNARNTDKYKLLTKIIFSLCVSS